MFFKKKVNKFYNIMTTIQNVLAGVTVIIAFAYLFDKELINSLVISLAIFLIVLSYNNYKFYKVKYLTLFGCLLAIFLLLGVII